MWIEIYDTNNCPTTALDLSPTSPKLYELRVVIWNTSDIILQEKNIFGTSMSDIYVKG